MYLLIYYLLLLQVCIKPLSNTCYHKHTSPPCIWYWSAWWFPRWQHHCLKHPEDNYNAHLKGNPTVVHEHCLWTNRKTGNIQKTWSLKWNAWILLPSDSINSSSEFPKNGIWLWWSADKRISEKRDLSNSSACSCSSMNCFLINLEGTATIL